MLSQERSHGPPRLCTRQVGMRGGGCEGGGNTYKIQVKKEDSPNIPIKKQNFSLK